MVCSRCILAGHCRRRFVRYVSFSETKDPVLIRLVRDHASQLFHKEGITPLGVRDFIANHYRRLGVTVVGTDGSEFFLPTDILDPPDWMIDAGRGKEFDEVLRQYIWRTFFVPMPPHVLPRVRNEHRDWFALIATFVMAMSPSEAALWPRHFGDNDNTRFPPLANNDNGPGG